MDKEFKSFKEACRYLVKDESKFWDTSFQIIEITVLEISEKAIKVKYENGSTKWYLKECFNFSIIENLSDYKVKTIEDRYHEVPFNDDWKGNEYDATLRLE
jgi:hypothetical protein